MEKSSVTDNYPILIGSIILQNSKIHMFNYLYKIYPRLFGNYKVLYMDTDSIYAKINISHDEYLKILEENKDLFGKNIGQMEPESIDNPIKEFITLSSVVVLLLLGVDVYRLGMSLSRPLAAPSTTVLSLAMSLATARHAAT